MLRSMTGYGEAQSQEGGHAYHIELRSVNSRYFKAQIRLPEEFAFLEPQLESLLRERLIRGAISARVFHRDMSASAAQDVNIAAVEHYLAKLKPLVDGDSTIDLARILQMPGVCEPQALTQSERDKAETRLAALTNAAIDRLIEMREKEGEALARDLRGQCESLLSNLEAINERAPSVVAEFRDRLLGRVQDLLRDSNVSLAQDDILREVSIYAERSDINEEISRLRGHIEQFLQSMESESAGRKLDFIAQEMLREANTIGSKSGDRDIARRIIDMKGAVDRIKEQAQNVE
ncbi:MAG: YicC family protein [Phycisphaerales bacterium]|nr:YicC family protein [Phycisphaerales bacterium]